MKRFIAIILASALVLSGCARQTTSTPSSTSPSTIENTVKVPTSKTSESEIDEPNSTAIPKAEGPNVTVAPANIPEFNDLGDPKLLQYVQDSVYAGLVEQFSSEDYMIENVSAIYYSKEYLEELDYNSKANIFFGYTLKELDEQFQGSRYVFTLSDEGETTVQPFEDYDDTYDQVIKNVAIGTGVILVCVTVSVVSGGGVYPVVKRIVKEIIFAVKKEPGTAVAIYSGVHKVVTVGTNTNMQTEEFDQAVKAAALSLSKIFMEAAINSLLDNEY